MKWSLSNNLFVKSFPVLFNLGLFLTNVLGLVWMYLCQSFALCTQRLYLYTYQRTTN